MFVRSDNRSLCEAHVEVNWNVLYVAEGMYFICQKELEHKLEKGFDIESEVAT